MTILILVGGTKDVVMHTSGRSTDMTKRYGHIREAVGKIRGLLAIVGAHGRHRPKAEMKGKKDRESRTANTPAR